MNTTSIDMIVRRGLLESNLPIHYYTEFLYHAATCLRELTFSTLKIINCQNLPVDASGNVFLPDDFSDDLAVCFTGGQSLQKLPRQEWITPLRLHDSTTGEFVPYTNQGQTQSTSFYGFPIIGTVWFFNVNSFGEPTGQFYGARGGTNSGYQVFKQQRRIQLTEDLAGTNIVLLYIGDGSSVDNATQIDPQAWATINAFINWKRSPYKDNKDAPEGRNFYNQMRTLSGRLDDLDCPTIRNILHNAYCAAAKN